MRSTQDTSTTISQASIQASSQTSSSLSTPSHYDPTHDDQSSPRTQAGRFSPPSSRQFTRWTIDQRQTYIREVGRRATEDSRYALEQARENENHWRRRYEALLTEESGQPLQPGSSGVMNPPYNPIRVAAVRRHYSSDSQSSSQESQWAQQNRFSHSDKKHRDD